MLTLEISVCLGQTGNLDVSDGEEEDKDKPLDPKLIEAVKQGKGPCTDRGSEAR